MVTRQKPNHSSCSLISSPFHPLQQQIKTVTADWCLWYRALRAAVCVLEHADKKSNLNNNNKGGRIVFLPPVQWRPEVRQEVLVSGGVSEAEGL